MLEIGPFKLKSRLLLGTGKFDNEQIQSAAITASETEVLTFAVRRMNLYDKELPNPLANVNLSKYITFPNTAGAHTAAEAVRIAEIAQHAGVCDMIKVEVIGMMTHYYRIHLKHMKLVKFYWIKVILYVLISLMM